MLYFIINFLFNFHHCYQRGFLNSFETVFFNLEEKVWKCEWLFKKKQKLTKMCVLFLSIWHNASPSCNWPIMHNHTSGYLNLSFFQLFFLWMHSVISNEMMASVWVVIFRNEEYDVNIISQKTFKIMSCSKKLFYIWAI